MGKIRFLHSSIEELGERCNEIEKKFLSALLTMEIEDAIVCRFVWFTWKNEARQVNYQLIPQYIIPELKKYRVDFFLFCPDTMFPQIAIEIDGHDFHEKTKEQASKDKKRDRDLAKVGVTTLRFTGSEVYLDPASCWREVFSVAEASIMRRGSEVSA